MRPENGVLKPYEHPYGYVARGFLLNLLKEGIPKLAHELHEYNATRPYCTQIQYLGSKANQEQMSLVFNFFKDEMGTIVLSLITKKNKLYFGEKAYCFQKLYHGSIDLKTIFTNSKNIKKFKINFLTPTYFNTMKGEYPVRLPIPKFIFSSLAHLYLHIFPETCLDYNDFANWIENNIYFTSGTISTKFQTIGKSKPVGGFIGNAIFGVKESRENAKQDLYSTLVETLCKLGEYTNIGVNRTAGFGTIQYYPLSYFLKKI